MYLLVFDKRIYLLFCFHVPRRNNDRIDADLRAWDFFDRFNFRQFAVRQAYQSQKHDYDAYEFFHGLLL